MAGAGGARHVWSVVYLRAHGLAVGRVDRGALEAGLVDVTFGSGRESLLPLLRERDGVSMEE